MGNELLHCPSCYVSTLCIARVRILSADRVSIPNCSRSFEELWSAVRVCRRYSSVPLVRHSSLHFKIRRGIPVPMLRSSVNRSPVEHHETRALRRRLWLVIRFLEVSGLLRPLRSKVGAIASRNLKRKFISAQHSIFSLNLPEPVQSKQSCVTEGK